MKAEESAAPARHSRSYFVDETGNGVVFDEKGRVLVGTGKVPDCFNLVMAEYRSIVELYRGT